MIIVPPSEIVRYVSVDEEGNWIHDPEMPKELEPVFEQFLKQVDEAREYKYNFGNISIEEKI